MSLNSTPATHSPCTTNSAYSTPPESPRSILRYKGHEGTWGDRHLPEPAPSIWEVFSALLGFQTTSREVKFNATQRVMLIPTKEELREAKQLESALKEEDADESLAELLWYASGPIKDDSIRFKQETLDELNEYIQEQRTRDLDFDRNIEKRLEQDPNLFLKLKKKMKRDLTMDWSKGIQLERANVARKIAMEALYQPKPEDRL